MDQESEQVSLNRFYTMNISDLGPTTVVKKGTKMKNKSNQHLSASLPSTSEEPSERRTSTMNNNLPHITPIPSDGNGGGVKFIQVSPITNLPKGNNLKLIKIASPIPGLNLTNIPKLQTTKQAPEASNVKVLKSVRNIKKAADKIAGQLHKMITKTSLHNISGVPNMAQPVSSSNTSIPTNQASANLTPKTRTIPSILQKKASHKRKNASKIEQQHTNPAPYVSDTEKKSNVKKASVCKLLTSQDKNISKEEQTNQSKPINQLTKPSKERQLQKSKSKNTSPDKKQKESRGKPKVYSEGSMYVADGFKEDVEILLEKCLQVSKLSFEKFTGIWKEMDFPRIFHGRQSSGELAELSEEVIHIAKAHMLAKNVSFEENVAGLFLVYALLNHQPFAGFASLRLIPYDVPLILSLEVEARRQKRHDVLYVLGSVLIKGPCQFHVLQREVSLEVPIKKYYDGTVQMPSRMDSVLTRNAECVPHFKELISLEQRYQAMRQKLRDRHSGRDKVSNLCKRPAAMLYDQYRAHIPHRVHSERSAEKINEILSPPAPDDDRADLLKSIKERAMSNIVDPMRHLAGIDDRLQDSMSSSSEESEVEVEVRKIRRKPKIKNKMPFATLQEIFGSEDNTEDPSLLEPSLEDMPTLNLDLATEEPTPNETYKEKLLPKKELELEKNYSKNSNQSKSYKNKQRNITDGPKSKRKSSTENDTTDLIKIGDLVSSDYGIEVNVEILNKYQSDDDDQEENNKSEEISENLKKSCKHETNTDMPSIIIEYEKVDEDIEMNKADDVKATEDSKKGRKNKKSSVSKEVSNNNTVSTKLGKNKINTETNKNDVSKKSKTTKKKSPMEDNNMTTEKIKTPTQGENISTPLTPQMKRKSDQTSPSTPRRSSPRKRKDTSCESDSDKPEPKRIKAEPWVRSRVKSSFKKLGILEVADNKHALSNKDSKSVKSKKKKK